MFLCLLTRGAMDSLLKEIEIAVGYHAKSKINKIDILLGDEILLGLIIDNIETEYEYEILHDKINTMMDNQFSVLTQTSESKQLEVVSSDITENQIDEAIVDILNLIENQFVRTELLRISLAPKKMLRGKMFLKLEKNDDFQTAGLIELFHLATLIQDDVIDRATVRRHKQTINAKYDDRTAMLISDYLLVHIGYVLGLRAKQQQPNPNRVTKNVQAYYRELLTDFINSLLASERIETSFATNEQYNQYASDKTAKFFQLVLVSGILANDNQASLTELQAIGKFGLEFGLLFQKIDDLLDYNNDISISGKDARDEENKVNNFILLNLKTMEIEQIKALLQKQATQLLESEYSIYFEAEIKNLIRRINE